jgi:integrase
MLNRLTVKAIPSLPPGRHGDGGGLWCDVTARGSRSWLLRYKVRNGSGVERWLGLGGYPSVSLARARELAAQARTMLAEGRDPLLEKQAVGLEQKREGRTVGDCVSSYMAAQKAGWRASTIKANESLLRTMNAEGGIGAKALGPLSVEDVAAWLLPIWTRTPQRGVKLRMLLSQALGYAEAMGWRDRNAKNPAEWSSLKHVLPKARAVKPVEHHRFVAGDDVREFWKALADHTGAGAEALRLIALTGVRHSEATHAEWSEFRLDGDGPLWSIPAARTKQRRPHLVPLTPAAVTVLRTMEKARRSDLVFAGILARKAISSTTMAAVLKRMGDGWHGRVTPHGLRASLRTWCAAQSVSAEVAEALLGHVADQVVRAYQRDDLLVQRREVLARWAAFVTSDEVGGARGLMSNQPAIRAMSTQAC